MGGFKVALVRQVGSDHRHQNRNDWRTWTREEREARAEVMETETREVMTRTKKAQSEGGGVPRRVQSLRSDFPDFTI